MIITYLQRNMTMEHLASFLDDADPSPIREQFDQNYVGGWHPMKGMTLLDGRSLHYPGDPLLEPLARIELEDGRKEFVLFYDHSIVAIVQPDGSFEVSRMD